jgi:phytoene synthase
VRASTGSRASGRRLQKETFRRGSRTYHTSSLFFPAAVRRDVFDLYAFVRTADDFVDSVPQDGASFRSFVRCYREAMERPEVGPSPDPIIAPFVELSRRRSFPAEWADAFLHSMELDLSRSVYATQEETLEYVHGSAEVIGLFMARLLGLPEVSYPHAMMLGRSMQYINFIRDLDEDRRLGRSYLSWDGPADRLADPRYARAHEAELRRYLEHHLALYEGWQREAGKGFAYIPRRYLIPIKTASDMYQWTAEMIRRDPLVVFERKVKPGRARIVLRVLGNALAPSGR